MRKRKQIILVDDHPLIIEGLSALLRKESGLCVCNRAGNGLQLLQLLGCCHADLVVLDINMPEMNGIEAATQIRAAHPDLLILCLSSHYDKALIQTLHALRVEGFVPKQMAGRQIVDVIHRVLAGERVFIKSEMENPFGKPEEQLLAGLGPKEQEIVQLIKQGKTNKEISATMHLGYETVKAYRRDICSKLNISGQGALLKFVVKGER